MKFLVAIILSVFFLLYTARLDLVPTYLNQDELGFALNAYSISHTGYDENGRFLPLYFWHLGLMWSTPVIVYLTSIFLIFLPLAENTIRLSSVLVGMVDLLLIYLLVNKLTKDKKLGFLALVFLGVTPIHFIQSRILLDNLYIVPFVLVWLLLLIEYLEKKKLWMLFLSALLLGIGVHSYHAAKVMMPIYMALTFVMIFPQIRARKLLFLVPLMGFVLPLIPLYFWLQNYPDTLIDQVRYTNLYDTNLNAAGGILSLLTYESFILRISTFLSYFNPEFLFFRGDSSLIHSTQKVGVLLLPFALLVPLGLYNIFKNERSKINMVIVAGFFSAPIAAALVLHSFRISKVLVILPFAIILAIYGFKFLSQSKNTLFRLITILLLIAIPLQFVYFIDDYLGGYRTRSYAWFNYNIPSALQSILDQSPQKIYLDDQVHFIDRYWKFYAIKNKRIDLLFKTEYVSNILRSPDSIKTESILMLRYDRMNTVKDLSNSGFNLSNKIFEPDETVSFYIYKN